MEGNAAMERLSWMTFWSSPIHHPLKPNLSASGMGLFTQTAHLWRGGKKKTLHCNQMLQSQSESLTKVTENQINARTKQKQEDLDSFIGHERDVCCHLLHSHDEKKNMHNLRRQLSGLPAFGFPRNHEMRTKKLPAVRQQFQPLHCHWKLSPTMNDSNISYW